jgi:cytoskeletal protein CcmA (bactofilin family)
MLRRAFGGTPRKEERAQTDQPGGWTAPAGEVEAPEGKRMDRQKERDWAPSSGAGMATSELNALLGKGSEFDGKLAFEGTVRIDGNFTGEITTSDTLIVGEGARVQAEVTCGAVVVHGEIIGNVKASQSVELHRPARLKGDVITPSLMIEKGVMFEGRAQMEQAASSKIIPIAASQGDD